MNLKKIKSFSKGKKLEKKDILKTWGITLSSSKHPQSKIMIVKTKTKS
jgi:hypothetical protein